MVAGLQ
jgi:hypothetical protein